MEIEYEVDSWLHLDIVRKFIKILYFLSADIKGTWYFHALIIVTLSFELINETL